MGRTQEEQVDIPNMINVLRRQDEETSFERNHVKSAAETQLKLSEAQ